jgi:hypothetical protein
VTEQRPPVDFDAQKAADRVAELIAEGSVLARGWAERFARRREDGAPAKAPTDPVAPAEASMGGEDAWSAACDDAAAPALPLADAVDPVVADGVPDPTEEVDVLMAALRATAARRLGVAPGRIHVTVALENQEQDTGSVTGALVPAPASKPERDPIDALTATLDDLAALARTRLSEELGVRLPDIVAEIRFPAGGRPTVRIRPSARAGPETSGAPGTPDLEAIVRRLLLGRDAR